VVSKLFTFNNHISNVNPIRAKADYAFSEVDGEIWVYYGTGIYEEQNDKTNFHTQYFFGLKDTSAGVPAYEMSSLVQTTVEFDTMTVDIEDCDGNVVPTEVAVRTITGSNPYNDPWVMILAPGAVGAERVITKPLVVGGVVFFTSFVPDANICEGSGDTYVFAIDYDTGLPPTEPIFDIDGDGDFDDDDMIDTDGDGIGDIVPAGVYVGRGQGSHPVLHEDTLFITTTGSGDEDAGGEGGLPGDNPGGGSHDIKVNTEWNRVSVEAWRQK
jgi:Tfp pilus tip-associated adhesin PilY1